MSEWNPGTAHFDDQEAEKSPIVTNDDYPTPGTAVTSLSNNPAKELTDGD